jgi:hypothetical protein
MTIGNQEIFSSARKENKRVLKSQCDNRNTLRIVDFGRDVAKTEFLIEYVGTITEFTVLIDSLPVDSSDLSVQPSFFLESSRVISIEPPITNFGTIALLSPVDTQLPGARDSKVMNWRLQVHRFEMAPKSALAQFK